MRLSLQFIALKETWLRLPIEQLCQAVSVPEKVGAKWNNSSIVKEHEIARACSSFLRKSTDGLYFEFAHFSVREYLEDSSLLENPDLRTYHISESSISDAVACQYLRFLQLKNFDCRPYQSPGGATDIHTENPALYKLYRSAALSWPRLVHKIQSDFSQPSEELFELQKLMLHPEKSNLYLNWAIQFCRILRTDRSEMDYVIHRVLNPGLSTLHVAAALELIEVGIWLLELDVPITSKVQVGSLLEFSIAGVSALVDKVEFYRRPAALYYIRHSSYVLTAELSARGETLSRQSENFNDRKLMLFACESIVLRYNFLPLILLLENGWRLSSEDISIARHHWAGKHLLFDDEEEDGGQFLDFVNCLNKLGIHKTELGYDLCALAWNMAILNRRSFTTDTSLLPSSITLSDEALVETAIRSIEDDDLTTLKACEQDGRFNLHELVSGRGQYALHIAAQSGSWKALKYIIDAGCEIRQSDFDGETVLHALAYHWPTANDETLSRHLEEIVATLVPEYQELIGVVNLQGQTALDLALREQNEEISILLIKHYPKQLGCCHGQPCVWDQAAAAYSLEVVRTLVDIGFPLHPHCSDGRPFHSLSPYTDLEAFELLHTLYPNSLKSRLNGKLALESCLQKWAKRKPLILADMDVEFIRALLRYTEPLPSSSSEAIEFCCRLVSDFSSPHVEKAFELLQSFLELGTDIHHISGRTSVLETACRYFYTETVRDNDFAFSIMKAILDRIDSKKLNKLDAAENSILHTVCTETAIDKNWLIPELVKRGADVNIISPNKWFRTPLLAILNTYSEQSRIPAQTLLKLGANPASDIPDGWDAAQIASLRGAETFLHGLLLHLTTTSTPFDWKRRCSMTDGMDDTRRYLSGMNSLHLASAGGHQNCFKFFLDNDLVADVHATSEDGFSCLHFATFSGSPQMIDYLIDLGLDIDLATADGRTPLHLAVRNNGSLAVEKLLNKGAVAKKDIFGMTPMMYARTLRLDGIIEILAMHDTPHAEAQRPHVLAQDARHRYWRTACSKAISNADAQLCSQLMEQGCPVDFLLPECGGCSPLLMSIALSSPDNLEFVRLFLDNSASVCKQYCSQHFSRPALIEALRRPHLNCFLPRMLDLCLQEGSESVSRQMVFASVELGNTEALALIIAHVREHESSYA